MGKYKTATELYIEKINNEKNELNKKVKELTPFFDERIECDYGEKKGTGFSRNCSVGMNVYSKGNGGLLATGVASLVVDTERNRVNGRTALNKRVVAAHNSLPVTFVDKKFGSYLHGMQMSEVFRRYLFNRASTDLNTEFYS